MGLAASQARLLTITARKSDCEFQSMRLSHEKIALARDMERISDEYQSAMGKTKLVYDYYGSGTSPMPLNYNLLMTPSVYNDYYPKLITDKTNRVVLDSKLAEAARFAGIPVEGLSGTPSDSVRNAFIQALSGQDIISKETAASIQNVVYGNSIGLGSTYNVTSTQEVITYDKLLELIKANSISTTDFGLQLTGKLPDSNENDPGKSLVGRPWINYFYGTENQIKGIDKTGGNSSAQYEKTPLKSFSLSEFLESIGDPNATHHVIQLQSPKGAATTMTESAYMQQLLCGSGENDPSFLNWLNQSFLAVLGTGNENAIQYASDQIYNIIYPDSSVQEYAAKLTGTKYITGNRHDTEGHDCGERNSDFRDAIDKGSTCVDWDWGDNTWGTTRNNATSYIGPVHTYCGDAGNRGTRQSVAVDLTNLVQTYVTALAEYYQIQENGVSDYSFGLGKMSSATLITEDELKKLKFATSTTTDVSMGDENVAASFYDALFNMICTKGWVRNDQINDAAYMQEMLKNGSIFISSISNDGYFYQGTYNTDRYISEVSDDEAIAQAEAKYNSEKAKIQSKENTLDVKMKNLDTEISSLTTEYDTTKSVIQKAIEKSFKRYEA